MLQRFQDADGFVGYRSPLLVRCGVPHVFTTRAGGSVAPELDFRVRDGAAAERVARAAGVPGARLVTVAQVHGARVVRVDGEPLPARSEKADAVVSTRADVLVGVYTADCVPVLIARADGSRVAAAHAGWRGLVAGVIPAALEHLGPGARVAAIGPCLSRRRFEVGPEVAAAFEEAGLGAAVVPPATPGARPHVDLRAAAAAQLAEAGVEVETSDRCTWEHREEFFSYRRDVTHGSAPRTGSVGAVIAPGR